MNIGRNLRTGKQTTFLVFYSGLRDANVFNML